MDYRSPSHRSKQAPSPHPFTKPPKHPNSQSPQRPERHHSSALDHNPLTPLNPKHLNGPGEDRSKGVQSVMTQYSNAKKAKMPINSFRREEFVRKQNLLDLID